MDIDSIKRFLCRIGFHWWKNEELVYERKCQWCGREEEADEKASGYMGTSDIVWVEKKQSNNQLTNKNK
jgi:hypothetical protein